ncbi:UNVERIFIED_CONTAM: hypothetical protein RMT77_003874 [Armadillidium vulgare]
MMNGEINFSSIENCKGKSFNLPDAKKEFDNEDSIDSYPESIKHGMCLKDLLSQGFENPFGLEHQLNLNEKITYTSSPIKAVKGDMTPKSKSFEGRNELQNFMSFRFNNEHEENISLQRSQKDEIDYIDVDLNVNVSQIVDEVLKEEDQSYLFGESPKSTVAILPNHQNVLTYTNLSQSQDTTYFRANSEQENLNPSHINKREVEEGDDNDILLVLHPQPEWDLVPPSVAETCKQNNTYGESTNIISQSYSADDDDQMSLPNFIELVLSLNENKDRLAEYNSHISKNDRLATDISVVPAKADSDLFTPQEDGEMTFTVLDKKQIEITNLDKPHRLVYCDIQGKETAKKTFVKLNSYVDHKMPLKKRKLMLDENFESSNKGTTKLNTIDRDDSISSTMKHGQENCNAENSVENPNSSVKSIINLSVPQICVARWFQCVTLHPCLDSHDDVKIVPAAIRRNCQSEEYIDCLECHKQYLGPCYLHCKALVLDRNVIRNGSFKDRARCTMPWPFVLKESIISGAHLGVWTSVKIPKNLVFGPYEGKIISVTSLTSRSSYSWMISRVGHEPYLIDAEDTAFSNWLRYVNWGSDPSQNNLEAFHYLGQIFYRSTKVIQRNTELIVWYGEEYKKLQEGSLYDEKENTAGIAVEGNNESGLLPQNIVNGKRVSNEANLENNRRASTNSQLGQLDAAAAAKNVTPLIPGKRRRGRPPKLEPKKFVDQSTHPISTLVKNKKNENSFKGKENINNTEIINKKNTLNKDKKDVLRMTKEERKGRGRGRGRSKGKKIPLIPYVKNLNVWNSINRVVKAMTECLGGNDTNDSPTKDVERIDDITQLSEMKNGKEANNRQTDINEQYSVNRMHSPLNGNKEIFNAESQLATQDEDVSHVLDEGTPYAKLFFCLTCLSSFDNILLFLKDDLMHFKDLPLQCGCCQERFKTFKELKQHMTLEDPQSSKASEEYFMDIDLLFKCKECKSLLRHTKNLTVIFKTHLIDCHKSACTEILKEFNKFVSQQSQTEIIVELFDVCEDFSSCPFCFEKAIDVGKLNQHIFDHSSASIQKCKDCHVWFPSETLAQQHSKCHESKEHLIENSQGTVEIVNSIPNFPTCLVPRLQFMLSDEVKDKGYCKNLVYNRENNSKKNGDFSASVLNATEKNTVDSSLSHTTQEAQHPTLQKKKRGRKKSLFCKVCCKTFPDCSSLQKHKKSHKTKRVCHICNKSYVTNVGLKQHMMKLHCNTNVVCKTCDKTFTDMALLKQHKKIHRKTFTFDCTTCKKSFRTKLSYIYHISTHGGFSLTYNCDSCGKIFHSYTSYTTHTLKECPSKPAEQERLTNEIRSEEDHQEAFIEVTDEPNMMPIIM